MPHLRRAVAKKRWVSQGLNPSYGLLSAFRSVKDFQAVEQFYGGKRIPEDEFFLNTLTREFSIPRDRVDTFAKIFLDNLRFLRAFNPSNATDPQPLPDEAIPGTTPADKIPSSAPPREPRIREFLDTCFVMMPFGSWFDRYYQEIYTPAIKEAGFEPVRADELFTTGSVVEQIWEQIQKAKVLLADLSGKNANVFYELGLAHAAKKPVVFTSGLRDFWERHSDAEKPLSTWYQIVSRGTWGSPADLKRAFGANVDFVGDNRAIFDIGGNKYRLIAHFAYLHKTALIKFVGTHDDYDKIDAETV